MGLRSDRRAELRRCCKILVGRLMAEPGGDGRVPDDDARRGAGIRRQSNTTPSGSRAAPLVSSRDATAMFQAVPRRHEAPAQPELLLRGNQLFILGRSN